MKFVIFLLLWSGISLNSSAQGKSRVHVVTTWDNRQASLKLSIPIDDDLYVHVFWGRKTEDPKWMTRAIAEQVCKACFDELKKKCR